MKIYRKIFELKKEIKPIQKTKINEVTKSSYASIDDILNVIEPMLQESNMLLIQPIVGDELHTTIIDLDSLDSENNSITSTITLNKMGSAQDVGADVTYYRRIALVALFSLKSTEIDDDGNSTIVGKNHAKTSRRRSAGDTALNEVKEKLKKVAK